MGMLNNQRVYIYIYILYIYSVSDCTDTADANSSCVFFCEYTPLKKSSNSLYTVFLSCLFAPLPCCLLTLPRLAEAEILQMLGNIISAKHDGGINRITNLHNCSCTNDTNAQENNIYLKDNLQHNRIKSIQKCYFCLS